MAIGHIFISNCDEITLAAVQFFIRLKHFELENDPSSNYDEKSRMLYSYFQEIPSEKPKSFEAVKLFLGKKE